MVVEYMTWDWYLNNKVSVDAWAGYEKMTFFSSPMRAAEPMIPETAPGPRATAGQLAPAAIFGSARSPRRQSVCLCVHSKIV